MGILQGHRRPRVCRYGYDSRGAKFCVKIIDFPVSRLFVTELIKASHEGPRKVSLFYTHERTFLAKQLKGVDARDVCDAFTSFLRTQDFPPSGPSGEASRARPPHRKRLGAFAEPLWGRVRDALFFHAFNRKMK